MVEQSANNAFRQIRIPFYTPVPKALDQVRSIFASGARIVEVRGFPVKVYCVREPRDNVSILRDKVIGETKFPAILPRVKQVMRSGGYILRGGAEWRDRRRQVQPGFKVDQLKRYVAATPPMFEAHCADWLQQGETTGEVNLSDKFRLLITALNLKMFFSVEKNGQPLANLAKWTHYIEHRLVGVVPLWVPTPAHRRFNRYLKKLRGEFRAFMEERSKNIDAHQDLLTTLFKAKHGDSGEPWTIDDMIDESFSVYFGASVMAVSLSWACALLAQDKNYQQTLREASIAAKSSGDLEDILNSQELSDFINEALRIYPASWGYPRFCKDGMELAGIKVPAKSIVIPMIEEVQHNAEIWENPESLCPARFSAKEKQIEHGAHLPFGLGARTCLGANLAPMVLKVVICEILTKFEIDFTAGVHPAPEVEYGFEMQPRDDVKLQLIKLS